jgi:hypothetical protein
MESKNKHFVWVPLCLSSLSLSLSLSTKIRGKAKTMGFVTGSSCFMHSPICQSRFPSSSQSIFFYSSTRNAETKRKSIGPMASMHHEDPKNSVHYKRRAILLVGISVLPLLQLRAGALEGTGTSKLTIKTLKLLEIYVLVLYFLLLINFFPFG